MHPKRILLLATPIVLLLAACGGPPPGGGGSGADEVLIPPTTEVLDAADRQALTDVADDGTLTFRAGSGIAARLEPDDVVVAEPTGAAPMGLLRKVTNVRTEGDLVIVGTVGAELREAVHEGSLSVTIDLDEQDLASSLALQSGISVQAFQHDFDTDFGTGGLLQATGTLEIDPILDLDLGIRCDRKVLGVCAELPDLHVRVELGLEERTDLTITGDEDLDFDEELPVAAHDFSPLTFSIGPVPVVLTPRLEIYLTASGALTATLSFEADQELTLSGGFEYDSDSGFENVSRNESTFDHGGIDFTGEADARAAVGGRFRLFLYGVVGPFGALEAGPRLEANVQGLPLSGGILWRLEGCVTGTVGIDSVDVLDLQYDAELFDACASFASDANDPPNVSILAPNAGTQLFEGETVTLQGVAGDPDGQEVTCEWTSSVAGDPLPASGCEAAVVFATAGTRTLTLTGTDPAGASDTASVTIEVDPEPVVLPTIENPDDGQGLDPEETITLVGSASGGTPPYDFEWSVAWPTDSDFTGGEVFPIGTGSSLDWAPNDTLPVERCAGISGGRIILEVSDADGFTASRTVGVFIGRIC